MADIKDYSDYRQFLRDELEDRIHANRRYSLRCFARDLRLRPQVLSFVLNGKRGISLARATELADRLGMSPDRAQHFFTLVSWAGTRAAGTTNGIASGQVVALGSGPSSPTRTLNDEAFRAVSDWYHYAILELTQVRGFKHDLRWISARLGITPHEADQAISRLLQLGLLKESGGRLKKTEVLLATTHDVPATAIRKFQHQMLAKADVALESQGLEERDFSTMTAAIDVSKIPQAKKMIRDFRRKLMNYLSEGNPTEVYTIGIELFRITELKGQKD